MSAERKFTLNLRQNNTGKTLQIAITQQGKTFVPVYTFSGPSHLIFDSGSSKKGFSVISNRTTEEGNKVPVGYTIAVTGSSASLVTVTRREDGYLFIDKKSSTSYNDTTITITLTQDGSGKKITITVTLEGKPDDGIFKADPTTLSYSSDGGTKTSAITSTSKGKTIGWSVMDKSSVPDWITLSGESTGTLSITTKDSK